MAAGASVPGAAWCHLQGSGHRRGSDGAAGRRVRQPLRQAASFDRRGASSAQRPPATQAGSVPTWSVDHGLISHRPHPCNKLDLCRAGRHHRHGGTPQGAVLRRSAKRCQSTLVRVRVERDAAAPA